MQYSFSLLSLHCMSSLGDAPPSHPYLGGSGSCEGRRRPRQGAAVRAVRAHRLPPDAIRLRGGADSPAASEDKDEDGNATSSNWHMATSAGWARQGSTTSSALLLVVRLRCWGGHGGGRASSLSATTMLLPLLTSSSLILLGLASSSRSWRVQTGRRSVHADTSEGF